MDEYMMRRDALDRAVEVNGYQPNIEDILETAALFYVFLTMEPDEVQD